ncbi:MAG: sigma-54-dependent Fis family transcriptional regulator [Planctomycetia bacterium]|nr:MAG: sigma-54-dependent Fis family transcriptional regulator [Planctomycetia bacterium]
MAQTGFVLILTDDEDQGARLRDELRQRGHSGVVMSSLADAQDSIRARAPDVVLVQSAAGHAAAPPVLAELLDGAARDATLLIDGPVGELPAVRHVRIQRLDPDASLSTRAAAVAAAAAKAVARREDRLLRTQIEEHRQESFLGIVGTAPIMQKIIERIRKAARTKMTVLIYGETGTGKDLIAQAIHAHSDRARRPFKVVNCAGLNENLLESELFGHVKGAFTGAVSDRKGYFLAADGGTLFLDEIGDMPTSMQAKLLRALERREITPVGSTDVRRVDVRLVAATHRNLSKLVEEGQFREDLFYRLNTFVIEVPPLRERPADIPLLVDHLLLRANEEHGTHAPGVSSEAMHALCKHYWPGNVRELKNVIERTAVEVADRQIELEDLPEEIRGSRELAPAGHGLAGMTMAQIERRAIELALRATNGNREQAAKMLGIGVRTLYRKIKEYGL